MSEILIKLESPSAAPALSGAAESAPALTDHPKDVAHSVLAESGRDPITPGIVVALLKMARTASRPNDDYDAAWPIGVLAHLTAMGRDQVNGADYYACASLGWAKRKDHFHVLTGEGRYQADRYALKIAREEGLHLIKRIDVVRRGARFATARCSCGWSDRKTRAIASYMTNLSRSVDGHLRFVGVRT